MSKKYYLILIALILIVYPSAVLAEDKDGDLSNNIMKDTDTETLDINYNQDQLGDDKSISNDEEEKELTESDKPTDKELIEKKDEEILEEKDDSVLDVEYIEKRAVTNASTKSNANEEEVDKSFNLSPEEIINLKNDLNKLGFFVTMNYPSSYGPKTTAAVKEFQEYYGLEANGLADEKTLQRLEEALKNSLKRNDNSIKVRELKENLNLLGFSVGMNYPNNYGPATEQAVKLFQRNYGLRESGVADEFTLAKIDILLEESLKPGDNSKQVRLLKENLNSLGFKVGMNYPNNYGPATEKAVKAFQEYYGLRITGVADRYVLEKIDELLKNVLKRNDNSPKVYQLKKDLNKLGFSVSTNYPNNFGPATERAVKQFQSYYGLLSNGIANDVTLNKLKELIDNSFWESQSHSEIKKLKENLNKLGFSVSMNYPDRFGPATKKAIEKFQKHFGLKVTGVAEEKTLKKIDEILNSPLRKGKNSSAVRQLKEKLNDLGFSVTMNYPNNFGPATERAVKAFQKAYNLPVSGIVDDITLARINREHRNLIKIFIDPGHGGRDPGASGYNLREKDVALDIARAVRDHLEKNYVGISIKMSRSNDKYLSLDQRTNAANKWGADFFLSIHSNAGGGRGFESYVHNNASRDAINKQQIIHDYIIKEMGWGDRGKKKANFHVLRESNMSALLLEVLFIDNKQDNNQLKNKSNRKKIGQTIAEGIAKAFNLKRK